jgi:lipoprotein-releasing system permease protein
MGGIALGVAALVLALAALSGLQRGLREEVLRTTPEIEVEPSPGTDVEALAAAIDGLGGVEVSGRLRGTGWVLVAGAARPVDIVGYDGPLPRVLGAASRPPGVYVGERFARLHGLAPGDLVEVASTRSTLTPLGPMPRVRRLVLDDTFGDPPLDPRERLAVPFDAAAALIGTASHHLVVETGDLDRALAVAARIRALAPDTVRVRTWQDLNAPLLLALRLEKRLMFVAVFLIVLVGSLALISDLSLIIASRRAEIGILGTMGAGAGELRAVFLALGSLLALAGVAAGASVGWLLATAFDRWRLIRLPGEVFLLDHVPFLVSGVDLGWIAGATLTTAFACCWIGAGKAADLLPVEALRR